MAFSKSVKSTPAAATAHVLSIIGNVDMNNTDRSVNIQQMNHLRENNSSCLTDARTMGEDSDK